MIQHVTVEIGPDQVEDCVDFYGLLGFRRVDPPAGLGERTAWLQLGHTQVHLQWFEDAQPTREGHLAVVVSEYEATLQTLTQRGLDPDPRTEYWGSPRCFVRDPAGNKVELMAFPPERAGEAGPVTKAGGGKR